MFKNRDEAAQVLTKKLQKSGVEADRVLAVSPSSVKIAQKISEEKNIPFNVMMSADLSAEGDSPIFGAVSQEGTIFLDDAMIDEFYLERSYIQEIIQRKRSEINSEIKKKGLRPARDLKGEKVLLVSDGISSGMKTAASLGSVMKKGVKRRIVATPFISKHAYERISGLSDEIHQVRKPRFVASVKDGYVSDGSQETLI